MREGWSRQPQYDIPPGPNQNIGLTCKSGPDGTNPSGPLSNPYASGENHPNGRKREELKPSVLPDFDGSKGSTGSPAAFVYFAMKVIRWKIIRVAAVPSAIPAKDSSPKVRCSP